MDNCTVWIYFMINHRFLWKQPYNAGWYLSKYLSDIKAGWINFDGLIPATLRIGYWQDDKHQSSYNKPSCLPAFKGKPKQTKKFIKKYIMFVIDFHFIYFILFYLLFYKQYWPSIAYIRPSLLYNNIGCIFEYTYFICSGNTMRYCIFQLQFNVCTLTSMVKPVKSHQLFISK